MIGMHHLELQAGVEPADFERFIHGEVFASFPPSPTRVGMVAGHTLYREGISSLGRHYVWAMHWSGLDNAAAVRMMDEAYPAETLACMAKRTGFTTLQPTRFQPTGETPGREEP